MIKSQLMARIEGNPIEALAKPYQKSEAFQQIIEAFDTAQRKNTPNSEMEQNVKSIFASISEQVDQPYVPIYWIARAVPSLIPIAVPFIQNGAKSESDVVDAQKKLDTLVEIDYERKNPIEYTPNEDEIFVLTPRVERSIYNAIKYNEQGRDLLLMPMNDLPGIPGKLAVAIEQEGDRWGINLYLKSNEIDRSDDRDEANEFREYTGIFHGKKDVPLALETLDDELYNARLTDMAIGKIKFAKYPGGQPVQAKSIQQTFNSLQDSLPTVMGESWSVKPYNEKRVIIQREDASVYALSVSTFEKDSSSGIEITIDGFHLGRFSKEGMPRLTDDYGQFRADLQKELRFASSFLSWVYQHAREDMNYQINLQSPDFGLLDWMEGNNLIEKLSASSNSFKDLGGNYDLRLAVEEDANQFIRSYKGEKGSLKPQNTILYGETGIGKTALENGIAAKLIEEDIPVFVLKGDLFAQTMLENPENGVTHLKQMFYYLLMHGGAVMVRDFDALLGSRDNPQANTLIEGVLLSELERIKKDPAAWFVADTQFVGRISDALLNAHRIGKHREVPIEKDPQGIEHIVTAVVRKIDKEINNRTTPLEFAQIQTNYPFDLSQLAQKISNFGGMIPAQIERMIREEMQEHAGEGYNLDTNSLLQRVDRYAQERAEMMELREKQRAENLQITASEAVRTAQDALQRVMELETVIAEMREGMGGQISSVKEDLRVLNREIGGVDKKYAERLEDIERKLGNLEVQVKGAVVFTTNKVETPESHNTLPSN